MSGGDSLTRRQFAALAWAAMLSPLIRLAPGGLLPRAGRGAWLVPVLALPLLLLYAWGVERLLRRGPGEALWRIRRGLGPLWGRLLALGLGLWLGLYGGFVLRAGAERLVSSVYPESPLWIFAAGLLAAALPGGLGRRRTLGRCAQATAPVLAGVFLLVSALAAAQIDGRELWPPGGLRPAAAGTPVLLGGLSVVFLFPLFAPEEGERAPGWLLRPVGRLAAGALVLCVTVTGNFGAALAGCMTHPFFILIRNVQPGHLLERIEALVAALWVVSDLLLLGLLLQMAGTALAAAGPGAAGGSRRRGAAAAAALMAGAAWCAAPTALALEGVWRRVLLPGSAVWGFGILPLSMLIAARRGE